MKESNTKDKGGSLISSYKVFTSFIDQNSDGTVDVSKIFSTECYEYWVKTRKMAPKKPHESFRRCLTAHTRGSDGRKPFSEEAEKKILEVLRQKKRWPCFEKHEVSIGVQGFKALGFHEAKKKKGLQDYTDKTEAKAKKQKSLGEAQKPPTPKAKKTKLNMNGNEDKTHKPEKKELKKTFSSSSIGASSLGGASIGSNQSIGSSSNYDMEIDTKVPPARLWKKQKIDNINNILEPDTVLNELFSGHKPQDFGHVHTGFKPTYVNLQSFTSTNTYSQPQFVGPPQFIQHNPYFKHQQQAVSASALTALKPRMKRPRHGSSSTSTNSRDAEKEEADYSILMKLAQQVNKNKGNLPRYLFQNHPTFMNPTHLSGIVQTSQRQGCELFNPAGLYMLSISRDPNDPRFQMEYLLPENQLFDNSKPIGCNLISLKSFIHVDTDEMSRDIMKGDMRDMHGWAVRASRVEAYLTCRYGYPKLLKDGHVWMHRRVYTFDGRILVLKVHMTLLEDKNHAFVRFQDVSNEMQHILSPPNELI